MELANWTKRLLLSILILLTILSSANATWWDDEWNHRQIINITNKAGNLTDYQVRIELNDSNTNPEFNWSNNGDDLRFVDNSNSELSYWIEKWNPTEHKAVIWIKTPSLENNTKTRLYIYYGNPSATSESNSSLVFPILNPSFEETYNDGICNRATYWDFEDASTGYTSDGWLKIAKEPVTQGNQSWGIRWTGNSFNNKAQISQDAKMFQSMKLTFDILGPSTGNPYRSNHKIYIDNNLIKNCGYVTNGQKKTCSVDLAGYTGLHNLKLTWEQRTGDNLGNSKIDNVILRKYASPEPSVEIGSGSVKSRLPDIELSSADIEISNQPVLNEKVSVIANVENAGEVNASNITVRFLADGDNVDGGVPKNSTVIGEQVLDSIEAGGGAIAKTNWTLNDTGTLNLCVIVDPYDKIFELNESNNIAFKSVVVSMCPVNAQQELFSALNSELAGHGYDFYEKYYNYDDNATNQDSLKTCYTELEDDDIWFNYISSESRGLYPCSAYLFGPKIGVDTNNWYDGRTPVRGSYYPELEVEVIDDWLNTMPILCESNDAENFLLRLLETNKCGFESDGVYSQGNIIYNEDTNRSLVTTRFSGRFANPGGLVKGGDCQVEFDKYYDADSKRFGDNLRNLSCDVDLSIPSQEAGFGKNVSYTLGLVKFDGIVEANARLSPSASGGSRLSLEPHCIEPAGNIKANIGMDAVAKGELCLPSGCYEINSSLPVPEISAAEFTGEAVIPSEDFAPNDSLESLYLNPDGSHVTYEGLDNMNPVFRVATSKIDVEYEMGIDLKDMGIPCGESLPTSPPCNLTLCDGSIFHIDPWQHYWGFTEITVHSPVELHLYDSLGRHVGMNRSGKIEFEVPNSTYMEENGTKTVRFPTEVSKFTVLLKGTDDGDYDVNISRPIMIETVEGNATIKGINYGMKNIPTFKGKRDYYNIDFTQIEQRINEMVEKGLSTDKAIESGSDNITGVQNATKNPSLLHTRDVVVYSGEEATISTKLNSLDKSICNQTIIFTLDGETIGHKVTNDEGEAILNYSVPHDVDIGVHELECVFNGSESYYNSTATARLKVLNKRPQVNISVSDFPSGSVVVNGSIIDPNANNVSMKIDGRTVSDSVPYTWNTTKYYNGYHRIELVANDSFGKTGKAINYVFVHNPIADAGGPYKGLEGHNILLNGTGSYDPYDEITSWLWDLDGDGIWEINATENKGKASYAWGDDHSGIISLQVRDNFGGVDINSTKVVVHNVAPTVVAGSPKEIIAGDTAYFNGSFSDPGWLDEHNINWSFGDGHNSAELNTTHAYYQKGSYEANLTVEDDDGGIGSDSTKVMVNPIPANITIKPQVLNLQSKGKLTAFITLPEKYNITNINSESIVCDNTSAEWVKTTDNNSIIAKFGREGLNTTYGDVANLTIEGEVLYNGGYADFEGSDTVELKWGKERDRERKRHEEGYGMKFREYED